MRNKMLDPKMCQTEVPTPGLRGVYSHQCTKPVWKDGVCKIHHAESVAERQRKSEEHYKNHSPHAALMRAFDKIAELQAEIKRLKGE